MRARLLDATIACLAEQGWAAMSTNDVVRRAHVSRGALVHHFSSKSALMRAAAERLVHQRAVEFEQVFDALPLDRRTFEGAIDLLWSYFEGPTFAAIVELTVAARTNPELRDVLADGPELILTTAYDTFVKVFPVMASESSTRELLQAVFALLSGLALQALVDADPEGRRAELLTTVKALAVAFVPNRR